MGIYSEWHPAAHVDLRPGIFLQRVAKGDELRACDRVVPLYLDAEQPPSIEAPDVAGTFDPDHLPIYAQPVLTQVLPLTFVHASPLTQTASDSQEHTRRYQKK